jgi:hypothetical protein
MSRSRIPLTSWFHAIQLHASAQSINALQLSRILSVTYKTAWLICHKIRYVMSQAEARQLLSGLVKISDAIYCKATSADIFNWKPREQSLLIGASEAGPGIIGRIKIQVQNRQLLRSPFHSPDPTRFIAQNVAFASRAQVSVTSYCRGRRNWTLINICRDAERTFALVFGGIGPKHLQAYLDQFCFLWNRQHCSGVFDELLAHCGKYKAIDYGTLVGKKSKSKRFVPIVPVKQSSAS